LQPADDSLSSSGETRRQETTLDLARERDNRDMRGLFVGLVCVLLGVGVQMVQSASLTSMPSRADTVFLSKHLIYLLTAVCCGIIASRLSADFLKRHAQTMFTALCVLLVLVLVPGIGTRVNGAQRWLRLGSLSLQPSELGRVVLPITAAVRLTQLRAEGGFSLKTVPSTLLPLLIVLPLVIKEPDLGATVFLATGYIVALFIGGWPLKYFLGSTVLVIPAAASLLILKPYQAERITGFMAAWRDLSQAPWQIKQSLMSLGAGGLEGSGIGGGGRGRS